MEPARNPFQSPGSEIGSDRPVLDHAALERAPVRRWALIAILAAQLAVGLLGLVAVTLTGLGIPALLVAAVIQVAPYAGAIVYLVRKSPNGLGFAILCGALFSNLNGNATAPLGLIAQLVGLTLIGLSVSILWSHGMFRRRRARAGAPPDS